MGSCAKLCFEETCSWPDTINLWSWLKMFFIQACLRKTLFSAVHFVFLLGFMSLVFRRYHKPKHNVLIGRAFFFSQILTILVSVLHLISSIWRLWVGYGSMISFHEIMFSVIQATVWLFSFWVLVTEKRAARDVHFVILRVWWVVNFILCSLDLPSYVFEKTMGSELLNFVTSSASVIVAAFFFVVSCQGSTGVVLSDDSTKPLICDFDSNDLQEYVTPYENAGYISKALFMWMNPLLQVGSKRTLQVEDVPRLKVEDRAENLYENFETNWRKQVEDHSIAWALVTSHSQQLYFTGFLYFAKLCVMYVGPLMIQQFIDFSAREDAYWTEGIQLVLILLLAKLCEELIERQRSFLVWKLSMSVKSTLIAAVFRKSLRLSNAARQNHGTGQIVNYMSVDVEEVSNFVVSVHNLWMMPMQIILALIILFKFMGLPTLAGLGTMIILMCFCLVISSRQRQFWKHIMSCKDARLKVTNEAISNIKVLKMQAWQDWFLKKVQKARKNEQVWAAKLMYVAALSIFLLWLSPLAVSVATFRASVLLRRKLTAGRVFTAIATFRILQEPLRSFPSVIMASAQAGISLNRLKRYFDSEELNPNAVERYLPNDIFAVNIDKASFQWDPQPEKATLDNINLQIKPGSLVTVVGTVGSGKSSLLASILGEMEKISGTIKVSGQLAYVAQSSWIQNGTIQENILFGKPMDSSLYSDTLRVCALQSDLAQFGHGDQTLIGERGYNLSGGQKQRIQLARAVYQDRDIYLLDDIFSAVDAHTGTTIFMECIRGHLAKKTIILVTHQIEFLHGADLIVVMRDGKIVQSADFNSLLSDGVDFAELVDAHNQALQTINLNEQNNEGEVASSVVSRCSSISCDSDGGKISQKQEDTSNMIDEEERAIGRVDKTAYWAYVTQAFNGFHIIILIMIQSVWQGLQIASDFWLAYSTADVDKPNFNPNKFIAVYSILAIGSGCFVLMRSMLISFTGLITAQKLYVSMLKSIFRAPMLFFDMTPTGRILTRSSTDQVTVDFTLPFLYGSGLANGFQLIGVLIVTSRVTWQLVLVILPLTWIYFRYQTYFILSSRELTRLKSISEAPVIHHFKETISGFMTIRAFGHQERFAKVNVDRVNTTMAISFHNAGANDWLSFRIESVGIILLCASALFLVLLPKNYVNPEFVGLSLSYGLALSGCLNYMIFCICQVEQNMVAVERILQYSSISPEESSITAENHPSQNWPDHGRVIVENLKLRYRLGSPLVLKNLSFVVEGGEKLGIVGRTGSGKSSFVQALFRLVEPVNGAIIIDSVNISTINLNDLRSRISIIPQEPTLFEGTVRTNIDPLGIYQDHEIWEALEKCQLCDEVRQKKDKLETQVTENGENWSMGQRQLFCLGRVLLKRTKILVLDEATASIDTQTDWILQKIIQEEFSDCTVISIAHRIPSVMGSDKVLVMDNGEAKEFGAPSLLLESRSSLFASLVHEYWSRSMSASKLSETN